MAEIKDIFPRALYYVCVLSAIVCVPIFSSIAKSHRKAALYAAVVLINDHQEVLLLRRKGTSFGDGLYSIPGGRIEDEESALQAACREVFEEVGVSVKDLAMVHVADIEDRQGGLYIITFIARTWEGDPANCEPEKCDDIRWFAIDSLPDAMIIPHRVAIEHAFKRPSYGTYGYQ